MSEAPERILAECDFNDHFNPARDDWTIGHWRVAGEPIHKEVEYVRADRLTAVEAERDALKAESERLRWEAKCLGETLDAWFDRRKLGHDAVDQAVIDAASGYLRTSRVGGMSNEESDMILGVIQDMARRGLFADLFARAALKGDAP